MLSSFLHRYSKQLDTILVIAVITGLTWYVYGIALQFDFSAIDDSFLVLGNLAVRSTFADALRLAFTTYDPELYLPLTILSLHADFTMWKLNPFGFHLTNLILHALNGCLVAWYVTLLTRKRLTGLVAAVLFTILPIQTEAVVWISARKDLLMTFFALLTLLSYEWHLRHTMKSYPWSVLFFLLALLSKVSVIGLPLVLLLRRRMIRDESWRQSIKYLAAHFLLAVIFAVVAIAGKAHIVDTYGIGETLLLACKSLAYTIGKLFLLLPLQVSYDQLQTVSLVSPDYAFAVFLTLALIGFTVWMWRRGVSFAFGLAFFLLLLAPTLFNARMGGIPTLAADHYAYLPCIGLLLIVAQLYELLRTNLNKQWLSGLAALVAAVIAILVVQSKKAVMTWSLPDTLFSHTLEVAPSSVSARIALVNLKKAEGDLQGAFDTLKEGLRYGDDARLHLSAGYIYAKTGDIESAKEEFEKAQVMAPSTPDALYALGSLLRQTGDSTTAETDLRQAIVMDPSFVEARLELARILLAQNKTDEAVTQLKLALQWNPSSADAHVMLATILQKQNNFPEAKKHLDDARHVTDVPTTELLLALVRQAMGEKRWMDADSVLRRVLHDDPKNAEAIRLKKIVDENR